MISSVLSDRLMVVRRAMLANFVIFALQPGTLHMPCPLKQHICDFSILTFLASLQHDTLPCNVKEDVRAKQVIHKRQALLIRAVLLSVLDAPEVLSSSDLQPCNKINKQGESHKGSKQS